MLFKITLCLTWTFLENSITSVLCNGTPDNELPKEATCLGNTKACSLGLKCHTGMMVELPIEGLIGPHGPVGETGNAGPAGDPGMKGGKGAKGHSGPTGLPGFKGKKGENCDPGARGEKGEEGQKGDRGGPGPRGDAGPQGQPGAQGVQGTDGMPGPQGGPGTLGETGPSGPPGPIGPLGEPGPPGLPGLDGLPGEPGSPGLPGPPGKSNECRVAFHIGVQTSKDYSRITVNTPLEFDRVLLNEKDGFIPTEGKFVAPFKGTFSFYVSVAAQEGKLGAIIVQHKGKHVGTVYADSRATWGAASSTFILKLEAKEDVRFLVAKSAPNLYGSMYTSVSGSCAWHDT